MRALLSRITPSMVIALVALGVALGGTSVAANVTKAIRGSDIARGTLPADRLRANSVTGRQINEARLARVPRARLADSATNARALGSRPAAQYRTFASQAIPSGVTVIGSFGFSASHQPAMPGDITNTELKQVVSLPGLATNDLTDDNVNFAPSNAVEDPDPACTGGPLAPTAPAGKVCLYLSASVGVGTTVTGDAIPLLAGSRTGFVVHAKQANSASGVFGTWAYTAP